PISALVYDFSTIQITLLLGIFSPLVVTVILVGVLRNSKNGSTNPKH
ncbi:hypothetical protein LCGC14_2118690, partial [marine sediment metagenome]